MSTGSPIKPNNVFATSLVTVKRTNRRDTMIYDLSAPVLIFRFTHSIALSPRTFFLSHLRNVFSVPDAIKFGVSRLVSRSSEEEDENNLNNNLKGYEANCYNSGDEMCSPRREGRWEPSRPSPSTSPELEVDSPPRSRTNTPSPRPPSVTEISKSEAPVKRSETFSVSALLRPDNPNKNKKDNCYQETISVTRSYFCPPFADLLKTSQVRGSTSQEDGFGEQGSCDETVISKTFILLSGERDIQDLSFRSRTPSCAR